MLGHSARDVHPENVTLPQLQDAILDPEMLEQLFQDIQRCTVVDEVQLKGGPMVMVSGQAVGIAAATGPQVPPTSPVGTLDTPRQVLYATAGYGNGSYTQALNVSLTIPELSRVGTYTGTLTTTITAAP